MLRKKNIGLFLVVFFASVSTLKAQYQSIFGINQTSWKYAYYTCLSCPPEIDSVSVVYNADTTINGEIFKKVQSNYKMQNAFGSSYYLREDLASGTVEYWNGVHGDTTAYLLMDLNLTVGDTLKSLFAVVDSVYFINGRKYLRTNLVSNGMAFTMVEGVGTNFGIDFLRFGLSEGLLCQQKDNVQNYTGTHATFDCNSTITSIRENNSSDDIMIYPNPASDVLYFSDANNYTARIELIDMKGQVVKQINSPLDAITIQEVESGIYMAKIYSDKGIVVQKLLVAK